MSDGTIRRISAALRMRADEQMLADGASFEAFREFCVRSWEGAALGDETAPESAKTIVSAIHEGFGSIRAALRHDGCGRYAELDGPAETL